jgi:hypothetical protein
MFETMRIQEASFFSVTAESVHAQIVEERRFKGFFISLRSGLAALVLLDDVLERS